MSLSYFGSRRQQLRRGTVALAVVACLVVVAGLLGNLLSTALGAHRELKTLQQLRQTEWLLDAGLTRARQQLAQNDTYTGETWDLSQVFPQYEQAQVVIQIQSTAEDGLRIVEITAGTGLPTSGHAIQRSGVFRWSTP